MTLTGLLQTHWSRYVGLVSQSHEPKRGKGTAVYSAMSFRNDRRGADTKLNAFVALANEVLANETEVTR